MSICRRGFPYFTGEVTAVLLVWQKDRIRANLNHSCHSNDCIVVANKINTSVTGFCLALFISCLCQTIMCSM